MHHDEFTTAASSRIGDLGWAFYFAPATMARAEELGLDGFRLYFLGRAGVLGDVEAPVVISALGYFEPTLVTTMWDSARAVLPAAEGGREYVRCCQAFGRAALADVTGLESFCAAAAAVNDHAAAHLAGLTLYAAWTTPPLPDDPPARAMQLLTVLREFRGSAHLAAVVANRLAVKTAHFLARPEMWGAFGYSDDDQPLATDQDRERLARAQAMTHQQVTPAYAVLDTAAQRALLDGLEAIEAALATPSS